MATKKETIEFILGKLRDRGRFSARAMFGEYALYADAKVVALVCDDLLYVKILPVSRELERTCEQGEPYPGAKPHYIVEEGQLSTMENLPAILGAVAESILEKKNKAKRKRTARKPPLRDQHNKIGPTPRPQPGRRREH
jgi:TfoX/Sxy family transcriptional regulator of competence genes